jgi:C4-dicarboxylate-specific signal transduction histidine kinase
MNVNWELISDAGLQFFGKMSASISHEIKNALAVINENAGLLDDLTLMAEKGAPMDPARLRRLAATVIKQIRRADGIVKNMNKFAHSVDEPIKAVNIVDVLEVMRELSARLAAMRSVTVDLRYSGDPVVIHTRPFFLENVIWLCLDFAMNLAGEKGAIALSPEEDRGIVRVRFTGVESLRKAQPSGFPGEREKPLFEVLGAQCMTDAGKAELVLTLPDTLPQ